MNYNICFYLPFNGKVEGCGFIMTSLIQRRDSWLRRGLENSGSIYFFYRDVLFKYPFLRLFNMYVLTRAKLLRRAVIYVIGDSHARAFVFKVPFIVHHISQATAYNLGKDNSYSRSKIYLNSFLQRINKQRNIVLLVFGEIDARVHIYSQYRKQNCASSIDDIITATVERYGDTIVKLRNQGFVVCIHGIPPAARKSYTSILPYTGSPQERAYISREFNEQLKRYCYSRGISYIDVQSVSKDEEGFIRDEYAADELHHNGKIVPFIMNVIAQTFKNQRF